MPYLKSFKIMLIILISLALLIVAVGIYAPYIIGNFLDNLIKGSTIQDVIRFCVLFGSLSLIKIIIGYISTVIQTKVQLQMSYKLNMDIIKHIQSLSLSYCKKIDSAYLVKRLETDSATVISFCISMLRSIITNAFLLIVPFIILMTMNHITTVIMTSFMILYIGLYLLFKKHLYRVNLSFREKYDLFFSKLHEQLKYVKIIKLNSNQRELNNRVDDGFKQYKAITINNTKINYLYTGADDIVSSIAQIALFIIGGTQILVGSFTIGMFTIYASYFNMMLSASKYFFSLGAYYQSALVTYDRIDEIQNQIVESNGDIYIDDVSKISLRALNFQHKPGSLCNYYNSENYVEDGKEQKNKNLNKKSLEFIEEKSILKNLNHEFQKGNIYAITGANGIGKSTLMELITGQYIDEYHGFIEYDGIDIRNINMIEVRKKLFGISEQEPLLFSGDIGLNLQIGEHLEFSNECIKEKIKALNMDEFYNTRVEGYDKELDCDNISGGEKQKIAILRVLIKNPAVMVFDEPTSALDDDTAKNFIAHLIQIKRDKIIFIITHDELIKMKSDIVVNLY